jgi:hypothetical protein
MENIYQAGKLYEKVSQSTQRYSRYDSRVIWDHPAETHAIKREVQTSNGKVHTTWEVLPAYYAWRKKLENNPDPVRYPVGHSKGARASCIFALAENDDGTISTEPLNYVQARKQIYCRLYSKLIREQPLFHRLKQRLMKGENLNIIEVDVCHQEDLQYYKDKYGVDDDFIVSDTMLVTPANLKIMLNDTRHPFGHGYCLSAELLGINLEIL